jgi:shikimate kinase
MPHLYLIGYRGSGKSSVGATVAARLGWPFLDADTTLEADAGRSIRDIFATEGEGGFRDRESATVRKLSAGKPAVIATGGGVILRAENCELLRASGFVVWLKAPAELLWDRISIDPTTAARRPNLAGGGLDEVRALLAVREPLYAATAHAVVDATRSPEEVACDILDAWNCSPWCRTSS